MASKLSLYEVASLFRMSVSELADFIGYTRQALYLLHNGSKSICTGRYYASLKLLKFQSDKMYAGDLQKAEAERQERESYIRQMCENVGVLDITGKEETNV